jgi:hypothetical protein
LKQQNNPWIKWSLTALMFCGAFTTSLQLHTLTGLLFLIAGNVGWAAVLLSMKEWAAATVFIIMGSGWGLGLIKYFFF